MGIQRSKISKTLLRKRSQTADRPHFNSQSNLCNPNNQFQINGASTSAPQQAMSNRGNIGQIRPQFPVGMLNNPKLAMPPFINPNAYFTPNQFFPFPQGTFQNSALNNLPQLLANNVVNPSQFLPNGLLNVPNLVQNINQLLQLQMMNYGPQNLGPFLNTPPCGGNNNGVVPQPINGNVLNHNAAGMIDNGSHKAQLNENMLSPSASNVQNNAGVANGVNRNNNWRKPHNKNFTGNQKYDAPQRGFGNRKFQNRQNAHGNFKFNNENQGKGNKNIGAKTLNSYNEQSQVGKKRHIVSGVISLKKYQIGWFGRYRKYYICPKWPRCLLSCIGTLILIAASYFSLCANRIDDRSQEQTGGYRFGYCD